MGLGRRIRIRCGGPHALEMVIDHDHQGRLQSSQTFGLLCVVSQHPQDVTGIVEKDQFEPEAPKRHQIRDGQDGGILLSLPVQQIGMHLIGELIQVPRLAGMAVAVLAMVSMAIRMGGVDSVVAVVAMVHRDQVVGQSEIEGNNQVQGRPHGVPLAFHSNGCCVNVVAIAIAIESRITIQIFAWNWMLLLLSLRLCLVGSKNARV